MLSDGIIQLSNGGYILEYPLSDTALAFPNLPRNGSFMLALLDRQEQTQGTMRLSFSEGAVIDATTGKDGVGYVMVSGDTDEVATVLRCISSSQKMGSFNVLCGCLTHIFRLPVCR